MPIVSIEGGNATQKTTFAYSAPLPIVGFAFDMGYERAFKGTAHEMFDGLKVKVVDYEVTFDNSGKPTYPKPQTQWADNDITIYKLPQPMQMDSYMLEGVSELWNYFLILMGWSFRDSKLASVVVDTMTIARKVRADGYLQELQEKGALEKPPNRRERLQQIEYGRPNDSIRELWTTAAGVDKNFIGLHHLKDEYMRTYTNGVADSQPTGNLELAGLNQEDTYKLVDVALRFEKQLNNGVMEVRSHFRKCGYDLDLENSALTLRNPTWDKVMAFIDERQGGRLDLPKAGRLVVATAGDGNGKST